VKTVPGDASTGEDASVQKGDDTRARMISATADLLEKHGFRATGLNKILSESGAPRGSLYFHFPGGKEELAAVALRDAGAAVERLLRAQADGARTAAEGLVAALGWLESRMVAAEFEKGCPVVMVALEAAATSEPLHHACSTIYRAWARAIADRLRSEGVEAQRADALADVVLAAIEGALVLCRAHRSSVPLRRVAAELPRLLAPDRPRASVVAR
jgi:TetR/AcrR family transcriptional repressor of lmrAB and yxaGH operons